MNRNIIIFLMTVLLIFCTSTGFAALEADAEALRQGSIVRAKQTSTVKPTAEMVMAKVEQAAQVIAEFGPEAFPRFKGADSDFIYAGTYVWIHSAKSGVMLMHPMIPTLEGQNVLFMRDKNSKMMFVEFNRTALEKGSGWVDYMWPKPGEKAPSLKVSYVKLVDHGQERYVVGSGVYDIPREDLPGVTGQ